MKTRVTVEVSQEATRKHALKTRGKSVPALPDVKSCYLPGTEPREGSERGTHSEMSLCMLQPRLFS